MEYHCNAVISKNDETIFKNNLNFLLDKKDYRYQINYNFKEIDIEQITINLDINTGDKFDSYIFEYVWSSLFKKIKLIETKFLSQKCKLII